MPVYNVIGICMRIVFFVEHFWVCSCSSRGCRAVALSPGHVTLTGARALQAPAAQLRAEGTSDSCLASEIFLP